MWEEGEDEEKMVLENWRLWGQVGTGFEHLPVLTRGMLFQADPEEEFEDEEVWEETSGEEDEEELPEGGVQEDVGGEEEVGEDEEEGEEEDEDEEEGEGEE